MATAPSPVAPRRRPGGGAPAAEDEANAVRTAPGGRRTLRLVTPTPGELKPVPFDQLVPRALSGDGRAWEMLVGQLQGVVWRVIAGFDLGLEDRKDVFAATFFRLNERLDTIREPAKLPGWMATTTRNEALVLLRARRRTVATDPVALPSPPAVEPVAEERLVDDELRRGVQQAFATLSPECRRLLALLTVDPPLSYKEIGELLGMPHGSIGPTRQRCLEQMRRADPLRSLIDRR